MKECDARLVFSTVLQRSYSNGWRYQINNPPEKKGETEAGVDLCLRSGNSGGFWHTRAVWMECTQMQWRYVLWVQCQCNARARQKKAVASAGGSKYVLSYCTTVERESGSQGSQLVQRERPQEMQVND